MKNIKKLVIMLSLLGCLNLNAMMKRFSSKFAASPTISAAAYSTGQAQQILGVQPSASQKEIKTAWRKLALKNHPDQGGSKEGFQKIQAAYEQLLLQPSSSNHSSYWHDTTAHTKQSTQQQKEDNREADREWHKRNWKDFAQKVREEEAERAKKEEDDRARAKANEDRMVDFWHKLYPHKTKEFIKELLRNGKFDQFMDEERARVKREQAERQATHEQKSKQEAAARESRYEKEDEDRNKRAQKEYDECLLKKTTLHLGKTWKWFQVQPINENEVWQAAKGFTTQNIKPETHTYTCSDDGRYWKIIFKKK